MSNTVKDLTCLDPWERMRESYRLTPPDRSRVEQAEEMLAHASKTGQLPHGYTWDSLRRHVWTCTIEYIEAFAANAHGCYAESCANSIAHLQKRIEKPDYALTPIIATEPPPAPTKRPKKKWGK